HSQRIPRPWLIQTPPDIIQRIFGTSQVFYSMDSKPRTTESTVPFKVREYYHQGHQCLEQEDWEMAVVFFSRALYLDPKLVDFYVFRAEAFIQLCDFSSAAQNLRRAYSHQPDNVKYLERLVFVLYLQGQCLYEQCDFQAALNVFLQASELQPQNPSFRYRSMACLLALKKHQDCLACITRETKQGNVNTDVYILRARIYNFFQKPKLCYQDLRSALLLEPKHPQAKGLLQMMVDQAQQACQDASILAVQGRLQRALKHINCAIENNPLDPSLFLFWGTLYRRLKEFDPAVEDFLKALDMVSDSQDHLVKQAQRQLLLTYNDFAVHCYSQGAYQEGVRLLNKAIKDKQNEKGLYINRGDCFFQMGNLVFAEADYKQALALNPQDEGVNIRMGMLQEKMGFCEQTHGQFQKAEDHFSVAIKHNPEKAQYYLHRARSRQLLQNLFGARQDMATVLLLNPNQPKVMPLMTNLFPGMTVEEVLGSQVAHLAKLQLRQMVESGPKASYPQSIVAQRLMERQKAQALLQQFQRYQQPFPEIPEEPETVKQGLSSHRVTSLTDSYVDQTSSGSVFSMDSIGTSEVDMSTSQEYRSTSNVAASLSEASLPKPQPSDSSREDLGLSGDPRMINTSQYQSQRSSKTTAAHDQRQNSSMTEATKGPKPRPTKNRAALSPKQRYRRAKAVRAQNWKPKTSEPQNHGLKLARTPSKIQLYVGGWSLRGASETQDLPPRPSKTESTHQQIQGFPGPGPEPQRGG
uniref:Tetratricopeptide repeat domain 16 n=1 Tax=Nannospalax galili TaxID=1026970 RepID=A0A8C6QPC8_NANGA